MRAVVKDTFLAFTVPLEGVVPYLYPDLKNLVSIGIGNLVDASPAPNPWERALGLPFVHADGTRATAREIQIEWEMMKELPPDPRGRTAAELGHLYAERFATLRLTEEGIQKLVMTTLDRDEAFLRRVFAEYDTWPADAQLGVLSMAWAVGAAFQPSWPKLTAALRMKDFRTAAIECFLPEETTISGLRPRNRADKILFSNAALVLERGLDPGVLYWPQDIDAESATEPAIAFVIPDPPESEDP
jgi:hypothetical protein